ncbi:MAG: hypothetical protein FWH23_00770 [Bacteroidales bacterium]|nr:hypothetical protein [Bacteroidales bacterium]MCL2133644.1 hypothetical protein [Bacteroidales bacterium]
MYQIANQYIISKKADLQRISGFSVFQKSETVTAAPLLTIEAEFPMLSWDTPPLHSFSLDNDEAICDFACAGDTYLFRMIPPQSAPFLMEITPQSEGFAARTNMNNQTPAYLLRFACWIAFGIAALHRRTVAIHASAITYRGKSALFLGESGVGKSTHTRLWLQHIPDAALLNDDSPFIQATEGNISVHGSPWSGKTSCFKNENTPVAAIVRLSQAPRNEITRLRGIRALGALLPSCPPVFAAHSPLADLIHEILAVVLQQIPVYHLCCLPDAQAAQLVLSTLEKDSCLC